MARGLSVVVLGGAIACGGGTASVADAGADQGGVSGPDASLADVPPQAAAVPCGDAACDPSQICLYPAYGCVAAPPADGGVCPSGWDYADASGACVQSPPPPSCVSPAPGAGSFDCAEGVAVPGCDLVSVPIPAGCSHVCRAICA